jgi:hypothetical protein
MCWIHNQGKKGLKIKQSTLQNAGKGLFAVTKKGGNRDRPVFKPNEVITKYDGLPRTAEEIDEMYGEYTAPYTLLVGRGQNEHNIDAACRRGIASLANHKPASRANAKLTETGNLTATKNIFDGQEIFASYGRAYRFDEPTTIKTK